VAFCARWGLTTAATSDQNRADGQGSPSRVATLCRSAVARLAASFASNGLDVAANGPSWTKTTIGSSGSSATLCHVGRPSCQFDRKDSLAFGTAERYRSG